MTAAGSIMNHSWVNGSQTYVLYCFTLASGSSTHGHFINVFGNLHYDRLLCSVGILSADYHRFRYVATLQVITYRSDINVKYHQANA